MHSTRIIPNATVDCREKTSTADVAGGSYWVWYHPQLEGGARVSLREKMNEISPSSTLSHTLRTLDVSQWVSLGQQMIMNVDLDLLRNGTYKYPPWLAFLCSSSASLNLWTVFVNSGGCGLECLVWDYVGGWERHLGGSLLPRTLNISPSIFV